MMRFLSPESKVRQKSPEPRKKVGRPKTTAVEGTLSLGEKRQAVRGRLTLLSVCLIFMTGPVFICTQSYSSTYLLVAAASRQGLEQDTTVVLVTIVLVTIVLVTIELIRIHVSLTILQCLTIFGAENRTEMTI